MTSLSEILQDAGLDIDLTYEDGLRLSELSGALAKAEYSLDHIITANLEIIALPAVIGIIAACWLMLIWSTPRPTLRLRGRESGSAEERIAIYESEMEAWRTVNNRALVKSATVASVVVIALVILLYVGYTAMLEGDIIGYRAQIDAILSKYEVMA